MRRWGGVIAGAAFVACSAFEAGNSGTAPASDAGADHAAPVTDGPSESGAPSRCPDGGFCDDFESGNLGRWEHLFPGTDNETVDVAIAERDGRRGNHALHATTKGAFGDAATTRVDAFAQKIQPVVPGGTLATRAWVRFGTVLTPVVYAFLMTARHDGDANRQYFIDGVVLDEAGKHWGLESDHTSRDYASAFATEGAKPNEWTCLELDVRLAPEDAIGRVRLFVEDRLVAELARSTVSAATVSEISTYELWAGISRPGPTSAGDLFLDDVAFAHFDDDPTGDAPRIGCRP
jgi:hypothetical protein